LADEFGFPLFFLHFAQESPEGQVRADGEGEGEVHYAVRGVAGGAAPDFVGVSWGFAKRVAGPAGRGNGLGLHGVDIERMSEACL